MRVLLVFETMYGNTQRIAEAIASGLSTVVDVTITDVADAPGDIPAGIDALVVGAPTHAFSLSRASTREAALHRSSAATDVPIGIREWLHALPDPGRPLVFAAFDTRVDMILIPGAASRSASRYARKRGYHVLEPQSFYVQGYQGPLVRGEVERARLWGEGLGRVLSGE